MRKLTLIFLFLTVLAVDAFDGLRAQTTGEADRDLLKETIGENTRELEDLRQRIDANKKLLGDLEGREAEYRRGHEEVQKEIELANRLMGEMLQKEEILREQAGLLETELGASRDVYFQRRRTLAASLRAMYVRGQASELETLATADSFSEMVARMKAGRTLARFICTLLRRENRQKRRSYESPNGPSTYFPEGRIGASWWAGEDSNLRRRHQQIYSLPPLTTREPAHGDARTRHVTSGASGGIRTHNHPLTKRELCR